MSSFAVLDILQLLIQLLINSLHFCALLLRWPSEAVIPLSHLCGLSTVARGSRVYGFPQVFRGPGTSFFTYAHGMITATWRFGAFLIAERRPRSSVVTSTRLTYGNHGVIMFYTRMATASLRRYAVSSRIRAVYCTNIHGGLTHIYGYSRWLCEYSRFLYTGFAEALRLLRYRRFSYGV